MIRYGSAMVMILLTVFTGVSVEAGERSMYPKSAFNFTWIKSHSRPCKPVDLLGTWRLLTYDSPYRFKNPRAPYLQPHQLFQFTSDGGMKSAHSPLPIQEDPAQVFARIPSDMAFSLDRQGLLLVQAHGTAETKEMWQCVAITRDRHDGEHPPSMKRGDILMKLVGANGQTMFMRQLRKDPA